MKSVLKRLTLLTRRETELIDITAEVRRAVEESGVRSGTAFRPGDPPVLEHDCSARRVDRLDRRLHDRLERLLQIERLRDGLGDAGQRLELVHAPWRLRVQLRVLDRLRHLARDRH